jgi:hypothetical protein
MDLAMQLAWTVLAAAAVALVARRRGARGLWWLVAAACIVVAGDKWLDLQTAVFAAGKEAARGLLAALGLADARKPVKAALLLAATLVALAAIVWLARRDRAIDRDKQLAVAGLALVVALVGLRFAPGMAWLADPRAGWAVEVVALVLVGVGLRGGFRRCDRTD